MDLLVTTNSGPKIADNNCTACNHTFPATTSKPALKFLLKLEEYKKNYSEVGGGNLIKRKIIETKVS